MLKKKIIVKHLVKSDKLKLKIEAVTTAKY